MNILGDEYGRREGDRQFGRTLFFWPAASADFAITINTPCPSHAYSMLVACMPSPGQWMWVRQQHLQALLLSICVYVWHVHVNTRCY